MSRSADPSLYRDRQSDSMFGGALGYGISVCSSSSKRDYDVAEPPRKLDLDGLTPFEKNFYVESPSVAAMSEKELEEYRLQREIIVEGQEVPKPVKSFSDVVFPEYVMQEIAKAGFVELTSIQAQGWPMALNGRDLIGIAETGSERRSGKTIAYLLPAIVHVIAQPILAPGDCPILLVLAPTCELAVHILQESTKFGASSRIKVHASMVEFQRNLKSVISKKSCKKLVEADWICIVQHVFRDGNRLADGLAHLGQRMVDDCVFFVEPPIQILSIYEEDIRGAARRRQSAASVMFCP